MDWLAGLASKPLDATFYQVGSIHIYSESAPPPGGGERNPFTRQRVPKGSP